MADKTMHHIVIGDDTFELIDEAGREETTALKEDLSESVGDLKSASDYISEKNFITFNSDSYIKNDYDDGTAISITPTSSTGWSCAVVNCSEGDIVYINGKGSSSGRLWSFLDSNNKIISKAVISEERHDMYLVAPANTAKVVLNSFTVDKGIFYVTKLPKALEFCDGAFVRTGYNAGTAVNLIAELNSDWSYAVASCQEGDVVYITGKGSSGARLWAFLNSSNEIISNAGIYDENVAVTAPENAVKVVVNSYIANHGKCEINYVEPLMERNTKRHKIVAGVIRNSGNGWEFIINDRHQGDLNCASVSTNENGEIVINYPDINAKKVISLLVAPDETFAEMGYTVGASVGIALSNISVYRTVPKCVYGLITYSNSTFNIDGDSSGISSVEWDSANNRLVITHDSFGTSAIPNFLITPYRYCKLLPRVYSYNASKVYVEFVDGDGNIANSPSSAMNIMFNRGSNTELERTKIDASTLVHQNGNFWFVGVFEI